MKQVYASLYKFQGLVRGVKRDAANSHFRNRYATLEAVTDTIRPHMQECGLFWYQAPGAIRENAIEVKTVIGHHESEECVEFVMEMPLAKRDPQGAGSALTYAMRYSLMAALGLPPTDDDAETAIDRENSRPSPEDVPSKSSAQLKRDGEYERVRDELAKDMQDVHTFAQFEKVKEHYRAEVKRNGWNAAFQFGLSELFMGYEADLQKKIEAENAATDAEVRRHPLNA